jgi:hypothetical protein
VLLFPKRSNAVAHFNIRFVDDGHGSIGALRVWNEKKDGTKTWEADLTLNEIRQIAERFIESILSEDHPDESAIQTGPSQETQEVAEGRKGYSRAGQPWSDEEINRLQERHSQGTRINELAVEFQRTEGAIRSRLAKRGLA